MEFVVQDKLEEEDHKKVIEFLGSLDYYCIEQHPDWVSQIKHYKECFLLGRDEKGEINCFGNVLLSANFFKTANLNFGPAFKNYEVLTKAIEFLHHYFSSRKFIFFSIQLGIFVSNETELLEYSLNKSFKIKYHFKPGNLWSSISVNLLRPETEILHSFSQNHRRAIKKAVTKNHLRISFENNEDYLASFTKVYIRMMEKRKLPFSEKKVFQEIISINKFLYEEKKGIIEYIIHDDIIIGGLILIFQGKEVRYYKGAADPDKREIPILHFGMFEAMKFFKEKGIEKLDLWGYNHFVNENDQIYNINNFKKGFGGGFTFFPKRMNFILKPGSFYIYNSLKKLKKRI